MAADQLHGNAAEKRSVYSAPSFLDHNLKTYDALAPQYRARCSADIIKDKPLVGTFFTALRARFVDHISLLDLGCGHGANLLLFEQLGVKTTGLEFAPAMMEVAKITSPCSTFILEEFLAAELQHNTFNGVFAKAFIHLFPQRECRRVLDKMKSLLVPQGLIYVATTLSEHSFEGYLEKTDYVGRPRRFRRIWAREDLIRFLTDSGFRVITVWTNREVGRGKVWLNIVAEVRNEQ